MNWLFKSYLLDNFMIGSNVRRDKHEVIIITVGEVRGQIF